MNTIGERVKAIRKSLGLTQTEFGEKVGITKGTLSALESGAGGLSNHVHRSILREFNVNPVWLDTGEGSMFLELSPEDEIGRFFGDVTDLPDDHVKKRLVKALAQLDEDDWRIVKEFSELLAKKAAKNDGS